MKKILFIIGVLILFSTISVLLLNIQNRKFYIGKWQADTSTLPNQGEMESLAYIFGDNYFIEESIFTTQGITVNASVKSYFNITDRSNDLLSGTITKKQLNNLKYSEQNLCKDDLECQTRKLFKSNIEKIYNNNLKVSENNKQNLFQVKKMNSAQILLESSFGNLTLRKV